MRWAITSIAALRAVAIASSLAVWGAPAEAQDWPTRPVRVIVPFGAGGSGDVLARLVAEHLGSVYHQQFVIENRTGAGGAIGVQAVASAEPNGYTIGVTNLSTLCLIPQINAAVAFDPMKSLTHIAYIGGAPVLLAAAQKTNVRTLDEFISYAKRDRFTFATSGVGSDGHLTGQAIAASLGLPLDHVPYTQTAQAIGDLVAGHVPFTTFTLSSSSAMLKAGRINGVALTAPERLPDFPDVPTFQELGHPDLVGTTWFSISGPPNMPKEIVEKLNAEIMAAVRRPAAQEAFRRDGFIARDMKPGEFTDFVAAETARWRPVIESAGLLVKK